MIDCPRCGQSYCIDNTGEFQAECGVCGHVFMVYPPMCHYGWRDSWLKKRCNLLNGFKNHQECVAVIPAAIRAKSFFVIGVSNPSVLSKIRTVSDQFSRGEIDEASARLELRSWLSKPENGGYDLQNPAMSNLASAARINLILRQNAAMVAAVGTYAEGMDSDIRDRWPYWRYCCHQGCDIHAAYNNRIYAKTDPIWRRIFPPWEFDCRCWVEDVDEDEARKSGVLRVSGGKLPPLPPSGYEFDWVAALELANASCVSDVNLTLKHGFSAGVAGTAEPINGQSGIIVRLRSLLCRLLH